jgi:uncharacterized membrane protein YgdD (TMEM256/DUF423 family)
LASRILILLAGLMGAAGVALAAEAAHGASGAGLDSAAYLLLFHAVAVLAGTAFLDKGQLWRPALIAALVAWVAGSVLFAADIGSRAFAGQRLFPLAAPAGGTVLIIAWLALALAAVGAARKQ